MIEVFLRWWAAQLLASLPAGLAADGGDRGLVAEGLPKDGGGMLVRLSARRRGREHGLGTFAPDGPGRTAMAAAAAPFRRAPVLLRVPPSALLEREVPLPLAAERNLAAVLGFEMDRLTPFRADAVHWSWTVLRRERAQDRIVVRLAVVPKARVQALLAALAAAGLVPGAIDVPAPSRPIVLRGAPGERDRWRRRALAGMGLACAVLAAAAVALPFVQQSARAAAAEGRITELRPRVERAEALRRRLAAGGTDADPVAAEQARVGDALDILAALTAVLPDDTFLTELALHGGQVTMSGQSGAAVRLIGAIAADPVFRNPAFTAPITRGEGANRRDVFSLRADASPDGGTPPGPGR